MEIRVYGKDLFRIGQLDNHTSLIWTRKFYEPGTFELHAPLTIENIKLLEVDNIIYKRGSKEAGVIEDIDFDESADQMKMIIKGRFLSSYLDRRLIKNTINYKKKTEVAMMDLIGIVTPIPNIVKGSIQNYTELIEFQATMKNLLTMETKLSKSSQIGYRCRPDFVNQKIIFETYKGIDRSSKQTTYDRVIFSERYENIYNAKYKKNKQNYKTLAVVGGEGEGSKRKYVTVGSGEGLELREIFVDAKDLSSEGLTAEEYTAALKQRGLEALVTNSIAESVECETDSQVNYTYKRDYDLGDIITIRKKGWNIELDQKITEITEVYENDQMYIIPTFGDPLPDKIDWSE